MPDAFFQDLFDKHPCARQGVPEEVNTETIAFCFHIMLFLCAVLLAGIRDRRLKGKHAEKENKNTEGCSGGVGREKRNRNLRRSHFQTAVGLD